jgi:hypothetical protein
MSQSVDGLMIHEEEGASARDASTSRSAGTGLLETAAARRRQGRLDLTRRRDVAARDRRCSTAPGTPGGVLVRLRRGSYQMERKHDTVRRCDDVSRRRDNMKEGKWWRSCWFDVNFTD